MLKKIGIGIICAVFACGILAGCGGGKSNKDDTVTALQALVTKDGTSIKIGDKDAHVLSLDTPPDIKRIDGESAGMVWMNGAIYGITMANERDLVKLIIKDKKIEVAKDSLKVGRTSYMDGTDGTNIYYRNGQRHHILRDGKDGGIIYDKDMGRFTPFPGGSEGLCWFDNAKVREVELKDGKVTDVDKDNWLQSSEMKSMNHIIVNGDSVFMAGWYDLKVLADGVIFEYNKSGKLIRKYGDGEAGKPGAIVKGIQTFAVTKDYVIVSDDTKDIKVYSRNDGKFIGSFKSEVLKFPTQPDCLTQISDNLVLAHNFSQTSSFTLISL